jgi:ribose transport system substrate-binding protein
MLRSLATWTSCLVLGLALGCDRGGGDSQGSSGGGGSGTGGNIRIAVIPKGTTHVFWKSVEAGARRAGEELGVEIIWKGPLKEDDKNGQIGVVEQFATEGVSGIVLAPLDDTALVPAVQSAAQRKIPVVIFDSGLKAAVGQDYVSFVATDNRKGGQLGGTELARLIGSNAARVVMMRYKEGSASTMEREAGFMEVMKQKPAVQRIVENRYGGATVSEAQTTAMNLMDEIQRADGVFTPNESTTMGMLLALRQNNLAGKIKFVGFDTSPPLVEALKNGEIQALVAQNPRKMGYEGVKTLVKHLKGEKVEQRVDTGVTLITKENLETPEVKELLGG